VVPNLERRVACEESAHGGDRETSSLKGGGGISLGEPPYQARGDRFTEKNLLSRGGQSTQS